MQHQNDYGSQYYNHEHPPSHFNANPISNPIEFASPSSVQPSYASAPPYSSYSPSYATPINAAAPVAAASHYPYSQQADSVQTLPPSAPSYSQPQPQSHDLPSQIFPYSTSYIPFFSQPELTPTPLPEQYSNNVQQPSPAPYHLHDSHTNYIQSNSSPDTFPRSDPNHTLSSVYSQSFAPRFDRGGGYYENSIQPSMSSAGSIGKNQSGFDNDYLEKIPERDFQYGYAISQDGELGDGIYAYDGGRSEPYGARGTAPRSSSSSAWGGFDDYGRSTSFSSGRNEQVGNAGKIIRAVPKAETKQDVKCGAQKFRVKLLPEGTTVNATDVLCQIGLDGIHMLDPSTNRTLRIYPLESVTRWEVLDSAIFCFWSKSLVDVDPKRIRLKSNSYTTSTILDTVTAASVQLKEMGGSNGGRSIGTTDSGKPSEQSNEKKKGITDWMNKMKLANEEKDHWVPDEAVSHCTSCGVAFGPFVRRHHCRNCGDIFCDKCSQGRTALTTDDNAQPVRVCDGCMAEVTQNLSLAKEAGNRSAAKQSHDDLARKLQEEMERNRKTPSGSKSSESSSGKKMREVACPICTVHLQVQVPSSGSETIECGVCQHPFLVSAH